MKKYSREEARSIINELLVEIFNRILAIEGQNLKDKGIKLSMSEVHVLEAIELTEEPTMSNIAKRLGITIGSLTTAINTLYQKGYVLRERDPEDRRKVVVGLLPKAMEVLKEHDSFHDEMIDSIFEEMELEKDELLIESLDKLSSYFKK
ncbi:MAG: MarR family transcriptional regulator [Candidatus Izemoplasmatales bacterium]|nr:MarR family transcriptional regulator [Candidatus Izemoplasmatales bacterium]